MAEGHAVVHWARRLAPLVGEPLVEVQMPRRWGDRPQGLVGQHVTHVETRGKHLLTHLSGGETLHTHGAQYGSWQVWAGTERWGRTLTTPPELQAEGHERWVYGRKGRPCLVCATPIEKLPQGAHDRATYHCPTCQR